MKGFSDNVKETKRTLSQLIETPPPPVDTSASAFYQWTNLLLQEALALAWAISTDADPKRTCQHELVPLRETLRELSQTIAHEIAHAETFANASPCTINREGTLVSLHHAQ